MVVVDSDHIVVGMITRSDLTENRLESHWHREVRIHIIIIFLHVIINFLK